MPTYRILTLGPRRQIRAAKDIDCDTDEDAIKQARQLLDGHDIELWKQGHFIEFFKSKD